MKEARARGLSLWLMPEGAEGRRLAELIEGFAARLGTRPFPPHLTLLPGIEGWAELGAFELGPFDLGPPGRL